MGEELKNRENSREENFQKGAFSRPKGSRASLEGHYRGTGLCRGVLEPRVKESPPFPGKHRCS